MNCHEVIIFSLVPDLNKWEVQSNLRKISVGFWNHHWAYNIMALNSINHYSCFNQQNFIETSNVHWMLNEDLKSAYLKILVYVQGTRQFVFMKIKISKEEF